MGFVLLFYHFVLAREKTYQTNRWYLLGGLLFSLIVPFMPFGISDSLLTFSGNTEVPQILSEVIESPNSETASQFHANSTRNSSVSHTSYFEWLTPFLLYCYGIVTLLLSFRMIRQLYRMQRKSMKNPAISFKGHKVVLVGEEVVPHTFWKTIFVNQEQYKNHEISEEVMVHELIHAEQNHSFDVLIIEILKTILWFNPVLYFYKTVIQVNHEYIADDKVLSNGADIVDYQTLLLKMRAGKSAHYLSTGLNFNITKKRFKMMTLQSSRARSSFKIALIVPFFLILGITFGCEPANIEDDNLTDSISLELVDSETIKLNGKTVSSSKFEAAFSDLIIDPKRTIIDLKVHKNTTMGLVTDVQEILRENGTLKINYTTVEPNDAEAKEVWRSKLKSRNILDLQINEEAEVIVNQDVTSLSSLSKLVKKFITNNGEAAGLSENPEKAIIAIKTVKRTPHDTYISAIDKILGVYDELRNQASMELFDKPYKALEEGSEKRNKIKNLYPKRISITDPSRS
ncbi:hypothetical protein G3569_08895 [Aliifodinibius halophilus]|uniref:Peptidase M56 domain-containing protein n=2 Tax=Fodinibius halophilus TaxID=1736908 RepID=A0A6M1T913_9BACT|nr:hypothetical protein [Fodinibius halophilus]